MSVLRINLHIRSDVSPKLFEALSKLPPRPRAEFLRRIAELGLQFTEGRASTSSCISVPSRAPAAGSDSAQENFGDDITNLIGSTLSLI